MDELSREFESAEIARRLANLVGVGVIDQVDHAAGRVRVRIGATLTDWLPWWALRAGTDRTWWAPEVGEQSVVLAPSGELGQGLVLVGGYSDSSPPPSSDPDEFRAEFADGCVISYHRGDHHLTATVPGDVTINATGDVTIAAKNITLVAEDQVVIMGDQIATWAETWHQEDVHGYGSRTTWTSGTSWTVESWSQGANITSHTYAVSPPQISTG